eukprot:scaffold62288_cov19-Tisochrysis_lutea.AAC.4
MPAVLNGCIVASLADVFDWLIPILRQTELETRAANQPNLFGARPFELRATALYRNKRRFAGVEEEKEGRMQVGLGRPFLAFRAVIGCLPVLQLLQSVDVMVNAGRQSSSSGHKRDAPPPTDKGANKKRRQDNPLGFR